MSRFVRASKYRHVFGQPNKKEYGIENVKVTNSAWDTNLLSASAKYLALNWNASGGGAFAILPLPSPFAPIPSFPSKLPDNIPLARSHTAPVLDTDWSPHDDALCASAGEDGKVLLWKVDSNAHDGWGEDGWVPRDFDPIGRVEVSARKVGMVQWHPTASNVLATASGEHTVKLWDVEGNSSGYGKANATLGGHADAIQSFTFNTTGTLLVTTSRDRKLRLFDPRLSGGEAVRTVDGHGGIKGARVVWMGETGRIATTGFSKMSDRQVSLWDAESLTNLKTVTVDQSSGVIMPFWSDNNILFLAGKGDGNIRFYEYSPDDTLYALSDHKSSDPQRGMCFLPRRALNVQECEIARAYKVHGACIEAVGFVVPRKSDSFQSDIFPPAPSSTPSLTGAEYFAGKTAPRNLVDLETGNAAPPSSSSASASAPQASVPTPTTSAPAPKPEQVAAPVQVEPTPTPALKVVEKVVEKSPEPVASPVISRSGSSFVPQEVSRSTSNSDSSLANENAQLNSDLRGAREKIRNLELQVESLRANAQRAAKALLE